MTGRHTLPATAPGPIDVSTVVAHGRLGATVTVAGDPSDTLSPETERSIRRHLCNICCSGGRGKRGPGVVCVLLPDGRRDRCRLGRIALGYRSESHLGR